jgi:hypothetical protein
MTWTRKSFAGFALILVAIETFALTLSVHPVALGIVATALD